MTAAILWKEYRQQRNVLLAFFLIALLIAAALQLPIFQAGTNPRALLDKQYLVYGLLIAIAIFQGLLTGALLFAEEKETNTAAFLDHLSPLRRSLFWRKLLAGLFAVVGQSVLLMALNWVFGFSEWKETLTILGISLDALIWGILAGVIFRTSLMAALAGLGMTLLSWWGWAFLVAMSRDILRIDPLDPTWPPFLVVSRSVLTLVPLLIGWTLYCRSDGERRTSGSGILASILRYLPPQERVLLWLILRQGRLLLLIAMPFVLIGGPLSNLFPFTFWPIATLAAGIIFGLFCFTHEQPDAVSFLGAQRLSSGRVWTVKVVFWFIALALVVGLTWFIAGGLNTGSGVRQEVRYYLEGLSFGNRLLLFAIWPLYGFCFGVLFGQVTKRPIIGFFLSIMLAPVIAFLWLPSLLLGGVPVLWVLTIPAILLATSRFLMRPWFSGRLGTVGALATMTLAAVLIALSISGFFLYRAVQVPDEGEPFGIAAFHAELDAAAKQEAGPLLRGAALSFRDYQEQSEQEFLAQTKAMDYYVRPWNRLNQPLGWPKDDEVLGQWIDRMIAGDWANQVEKASQLPLGVIQDPRVQTGLQAWPIRYGFGGMSSVLTARALQLEATGDSKGAIRCMDSAFGLSRQLRNFATESYFDVGRDIEWRALETIPNWIESFGPDKENLHSLLRTLVKHEAAIPDPANSIKAEYFAIKRIEWSNQNYQDLAGKVMLLARQIPWESERQQRLLSAATHKALEQINDMNQGRPYQPLFIQAEKGEFARNDPRFRIISHSDFAWKTVMSRWKVRLTLLITAVATYQAEQGKPPSKLDELVPNYLATLPINPFDGREFGYFISKGEDVVLSGDTGRVVEVVAGQGVVTALWATWPNFQRRAITTRWPIPIWNKK